MSLRFVPISRRRLTRSYIRQTPSGVWQVWEDGVWQASEGFKDFPPNEGVDDYELSWEDTKGEPQQSIKDIQS